MRDTGWEALQPPAGLVWLGARVYDPATRSFVSPDPLRAPFGHPWTGYAYQYAGNNPITGFDPSGLSVVGDRQLVEFRDNWGTGAWDRYGKTVTVLVVAGVFLATGAGAGVGLTIVAALLSAGISAGVQYHTTGHIDWARVGIDALIGATAARLGLHTRIFMGGTPALSSLAPTARTVLAGATAGLTETSAATVAMQATSGGDMLDPTAWAIALAGAPLGALGASVGPRPRLTVSAHVDPPVPPRGLRSPVVLNPGDREILDLLVQGLSVRQIAQTLGIPVLGAELRVSALLSKLDVPVPPAPVLRIPSEARALLDSMTERQRDVLVLLARGLTYAQIGRALGVSRNAVPTQVNAILAKLDLSSREEVQAWATANRVTGENVHG